MYPNCMSGCVQRSHPSGVGSQRNRSGPGFDPIAWVQTPVTLSAVLSMSLSSARVKDPSSQSGWVLFMLKVNWKQRKGEMKKKAGARRSTRRLIHIPWLLLRVAVAAGWSEGVNVWSSAWWVGTGLPLHELAGLMRSQPGEFDPLLEGQAHC